MLATLYGHSSPGAGKVACSALGLIKVATCIQDCERDLNRQMPGEKSSTLPPCRIRSSWLLTESIVPWANPKLIIGTIKATKFCESCRQKKIK